MHNFWIKKYKVDAEYGRLLLKESDLKNVISQIQKDEIVGINVTVPIKKKIIPYLDVLTPLAKEANSVNTVYKKNNKIIRDNTDIDGFSKSLNAINFNPKNKTAFIIGAGGVALSIIVALKKMGISIIKITNRTFSEPKLLKKKYPDLDIIQWGQNSEFDIIINATSYEKKKNKRIP